ncbi:hypothetical protein [uncultured Vagococcus sp.]|uniref:hypothetical protein n=1 Tax=uncultured Vagococcus sp. TaxID=189676 RepID=UPI0028D8F760|nr:hypothetical protein [uncultured Vagococcus sp.]
MIILLFILSGCAYSSEKKGDSPVADKENGVNMNESYEQFDKLAGSWHSDKWNTDLIITILEDNKIQLLFDGNKDITTLVSDEPSESMWELSSNDTDINYSIYYVDVNSIKVGLGIQQTSDSFSDGSTEIVKFTRIME